MAVDRKLKIITPYPKTKRYIRLLKPLPQLSPHTRVCGMSRDLNKNKSIKKLKWKFLTDKNSTYQGESNKVIPTSIMTKIDHATTKIHKNITTHKPLDASHKHILPTKMLNSKSLRTKIKTYSKTHINTYKLRRLLNPHAYKKNKK